MADTNDGKLRRLVYPFKAGETVPLKDVKWYHGEFNEHEYDEKDLRWVLDDALKNNKISKQTAEKIATAYGMLYGASLGEELSDTYNGFRVYKNSDSGKYYTIKDGKAMDITDAYNDKQKASSGSGSSYWQNLLTKTIKDYEAHNKELQARIDELENPKVWTGEEVAKLMGAEDYYNMNYLKNMYKNMTDKYYTDAIKEQNRINYEAAADTAAYANENMRKYADSYRYAAPTSMGKGTQAANLLATLMGSQVTNETTATNLNDIINGYREMWKRDLESNDELAREYYDNVGSWLAAKNTALNTAQVKNYINNLKAYNEKYTGIRNAQSTMAQGLANAYRDNAAAAVTRNQNAAAAASGDFLRKVYQMYYGNNWETAYNNRNFNVNNTNANSTTTI